MSLPAVPARPGGRSQNIDIPAVPARPSKRAIDPTVSPNRDSFARSPFNDPDTFRPSKSPGRSGLSYTSSHEEYPARAPSVSMPLVGEEGNEYEVVADAKTGSPAAVAGDPEPETMVPQTKQIDTDLPLHAPKATLPVSAATSRIQTVTRTDSNTAAAAGIGKPSKPTSEPDTNQSDIQTSQHSHALQLESTSRPGSSAPKSRPTSLYAKDEEEQGIPHIGISVPLLAHVGDVQAPTPSIENGPSSAPQGSSQQHKQSVSGKNHIRTKSGREVFSDSYGLHGHGIDKKDPFEKAWYEKHPAAKAIEENGEFGPRNPSERKAYHLSSAQLNKLVQEESHENDPHRSGTPDEQIGYLASEEYTSRLGSSRPPSSKRQSIQATESPLKRMESQDTAVDDPDTEEDDEEEGVFHVVSHQVPDHGFMPARPTSEAGDFDEAPILADDEVARRPHAQKREAAVGGYGDDESRDQSRAGSRVHSRSGSMHQQSIPRMEVTGDDENEAPKYEPLFDDDDKTAANKPSAVKDEDDDQGPRHTFPSKDIWEDTPDSHLYETSVSNPQVEEFSVPHAEHEPRHLFEKRETAPKAQRQESAEESAKLRGKGFKKDVLSEMVPTRPRQHRFPSRDVWEDTPDSALVTTELSDDPSNTATKLPEVPSRPGDRKGPVVPDRPKPTVPSRPGAKDGDAGAKAKPPVPAKSPAAGSKIAAIRGAFMTDLQSKLQAGPQSLARSTSDSSPEEERGAEQVEEKAPLADARKGRAKGPSRRKPGAAAGASSDSPAPSKPKVSFLSAVTIWSIDEDGTVEVTRKKPLEEVTKPTIKPAATSEPVTEKSEVKTETKDEETQTGTTQIEHSTTENPDEIEKANVFAGGRAPEKESVVVTDDGVERLGGEEGTHKVEQAGEQPDAVKAS